jgi:hypothetical protein
MERRALRLTITAPSSASGDPGADPNGIVQTTDKRSATTMTNQVKNESFVTFAGPTYGMVCRGVAYVPGGNQNSQGNQGN